MRNLKDWVGKKVQYQGWVDHWEDMGDGRTRYLFQVVDVAPWKHLHPEVGGKVRRFDHLWFFTDPLEGGEFGMSRSRKITRNEKLVGCGEVVRYFRSNGTIDYGVKHLKGIDVRALCEDLEGEYSPLKSSNEKLGAAEYLKEYVAEGRALYAFQGDLTAIAKFADHCIAHYKRQTDAEIKYGLLADENAKGKPKNLDLVKFKSNTNKSPSKGFQLIQK